MISLSDLRKVYRTRGDREVVALDGIDLHVPRGEVHGIVGESGAGKSMLIKAIMGIAPRGMRIMGRIELDGQDLNALKPKQRAKLVGRKVGIV